MFYLSSLRGWRERARGQGKFELANSIVEIANSRRVRSLAECCYLEFCVEEDAIGGLLRRGSF